MSWLPARYRLAARVRELEAITRRQRIECEAVRDLNTEMGMWLITQPPDVKQSWARHYVAYRERMSAR